MIGDFLSELFILDGMTAVSGVFGNAIPQTDPLQQVFELTDKNGSTMEIDITGADIFDTRRNGDKTVSSQVEAHVFYDGTDTDVVVQVILYQQEIKY